MSSPLENLEPRLVWSHFDGIRRVPRPSKHEEQIVEHVCAWAAEHGFPVRGDDAGNMVISVPASADREDAPTVVLQGHLDMVCEKNADVEHDFHRDPIDVRVEDGWVHANGTTLGADNGLGVAMAMAVAVDTDAVHGPLELLLTLDEETGLNGASALDGGLVSGQLLVNLDTEEDHAIYIGCAGSGGVIAHVPLTRTDAAAGASCELAVRGLRGGHSGVDIHEQRANAIKVMTRLLTDLMERGHDLALTGFKGGSMRNAIPRECFTGLVLEASARQAVAADVADLAETYADDYPGEPKLAISLDETGEDGTVPFDKMSRDRLLQTLAALPHGILRMSLEVPGLVETSNNLASVEMAGDKARIECTFRSSSTPASTETMRGIVSLFELAGAEIAADPGYPGWPPRPDSPLVLRTIETYEALFGAAPEVKAIHAGLECGILMQKVPGLDAVSIGPDIRNAHSPDEKTRIASTGKVYSWLCRLLADLAS